MIKKLEDIEERNPTEYWNIVKELKEKKADNSNVLVALVSTSVDKSKFNQKKLLFEKICKK